eukprot:gnl/TRDRNA2_/TRDRNA2_38549_c0_seq1.p1 gnl/TRDRNA2_/TRDRNA2_38549_c0~~gnl/TRDRNA2_/TRDRNA2_38549_c0_seq1.p1  ORF type:complete len:655 (-),score=103.65 gnl/TRDRNA2_/TRDRNA2_38549_c0_seq1:76-1986(-)
MASNAIQPLSEDEVDHIERRDAKLAKTFRSGKLPMLGAFLVEIINCTTMTLIVYSPGGNEPIELPEDMKPDLSLYVTLVWSIFGGFILLRLLLIVGWHFDIGHKSTSAGLYMFCSSFQFFIYFAIYFYVADKLLVVQSNPTISQEIVDNNGTWQEICDAVYDEKACDGPIQVPTVNGTNVDCCLKIIGSVKGVVPYVPFTFQRLSVSGYGSLYQWIAILAMSWVWHDIPIIKVDAFDKQFLEGVWLDVLDAVVFASTFIMSDAVVLPTYGLAGEGSEKGRKCLEADVECNEFWSPLIWTIWIVTATFALLSPTLYTAFKFCDHDDAKPRDVDMAMADLLNSIHLLKENKAASYLTETIELQTAKYAAAHDGPDEQQKVYVVPSSMGNGVAEYDLLNSDQDPGRPATAQMSANRPGEYDVTYTDGLEPETETVPVEEIRPDMDDQTKMCGKHCCRGWLNCHYLTDDFWTDGFERFATLLDVYRGFFFLDLPYAIIRFHFDIMQGNISFLFLKNLVFCILAVMQMLSCGNDAATCCGCTPIKTISSVIKGTKMASIWVGPSGMFRIAADTVANVGQLTLDDKIAKLDQHKAWLLVEKEKALEMGEAGKAAKITYMEQVQLVEQQIDFLEAEKAAVRTT